MSRVQDPTESLSQIITGIDNSRDVLHDKIFHGLPFLNGEILDLNMTGTRSGPVSLIIRIGSNALIDSGSSCSSTGGGEQVTLMSLFGDPFQ